jgi:hypothetical protein
MFLISCDSLRNEKKKKNSGSIRPADLIQASGEVDALQRRERDPLHTSGDGIFPRYCLEIWVIVQEHLQLWPIKRICLQACLNDLIE